MRLLSVVEVVLVSDKQGFPASGFRVYSWLFGLGFRVSASGFRVYVGVSGLGFRVRVPSWALGFLFEDRNIVPRFGGLGFRV